LQQVAALNIRLRHADQRNGHCECKHFLDTDRHWLAVSGADLVSLIAGCASLGKGVVTGAKTHRFGTSGHDLCRDPLMRRMVQRRQSKLACP
jgi:hypothetical protein